MLLEELLGISNKRLKYIFNGQNPAEDSSSTNSEEDKPPVDIISLDDVSEDDFVIIDSDSTGKKRDKFSNKKVKSEKLDKSKKSEPLNEDNLMSVLELLELQARARAIRSQLMLEANNKTTNDSASALESQKIESEDDDDDDSIIIEIPTNEEIVIDSSESDDDKKKRGMRTLASDNSSNQTHKKIKLIRDRIVVSVSNEKVQANVSKTIVEDLTNVSTAKINEQEPISTVLENSEPQPGLEDENNDQRNNDTQEMIEQKEKNKENHELIPDDDEIILIVDQQEMAGIIGE